MPARAALTPSSDPHVCICQDEMGYAVVTGNPQAPGAQPSNLLFDQAARWALFIRVALGPTLMGAASPLVSQPTEMNVVEPTAPAPR